MNWTRRNALKTSLAFTAATTFGIRSGRAAEHAEANVQRSHDEIWRRFIGADNILIDYADFEGKFPRPTAEECQAGKPNALGWWTPVENGSMFNGMYLDGLCQRALATGAAEDKEKARRLIKGLLLLSSLGPKGFVARGVATDGKTPYPMGSNDQTIPSLYGMWRYIRSGLASAEERKQIVDRFLEIVRVMEASKWLMPCNVGAPSPFRGGCGQFNWEGAPRLLFILKAAHDLTGDAHWDQLYRQLSVEPGGDPKTTRLEICEKGMVFHNPKWRECWTGVSGVAPLRGLWEMETDPKLRELYAKGLRISAEMAIPGIELAKKFNVNSQQAFLSDWRVLNEWWRPQHSEAEAVEVANLQSKELGKRSPQRYQEFVYMREPLFAAWVTTLCPDRAVVEPHRAAILETLAHYRYDKIYFSQFFPAEAAWFRLKGHGA